MNEDWTQTAAPSQKAQPAPPDTITDRERVASVIVKAFYVVYNELGYGFLERIYENALMLELQQRGLQVEQQKRILVHYKGEVMGEHFLDMIVENCVICELKAARELCDEHEAQLVNYLKATEIELGLLLNFGPKPKVRRKLFDNYRK